MAKYDHKKHRVKKGDKDMNAEVKEIYDVLEARPEIKELFKVIFSIPEERRDEAVKLALDYLESYVDGDFDHQIESVTEEEIVDRSAFRDLQLSDGETWSEAQSKTYMINEIIDYLKSCQEEPQLDTKVVFTIRGNGELRLSTFNDNLAGEIEASGFTAIEEGSVEE